MDNYANNNYYTVVFNIDSKLNNGYNQAFRQGSENWWWYEDDDDIDTPTAGNEPNFTNATFAGFYNYDKQLV